MDKRSLRKKDFITSVILVIFGTLVLVKSLQMILFVDLPGVKNVGWFVAPGVFPFFLSIAIITMGFILMAIGRKEGGGLNKKDWQKIKDSLHSSKFLITVFEVLLLIFYIFVLLGRIDFVVATIIYLFSSMLMVKATSWYKVAIISVSISIGVYYVFGTLFNIPLP